MKSTGIVRKLDPLGRIVLPMELRKTLNIEEKDPLEIFIDGECIILSEYDQLAFSDHMLKILAIRNLSPNYKVTRIGFPYYAEDCDSDFKLN